MFKCTACGSKDSITYLFIYNRGIIFFQNQNEATVSDFCVYSDCLLIPILLPFPSIIFLLSKYKLSIKIDFRRNFWISVRNIETNSNNSLNIEIVYIFCFTNPFKFSLKYLLTICHLPFKYSSYQQYMSFLSSYKEKSKEGSTARHSPNK